MMENRPKVAAFDFDGTLTVRDTLFEFIKFACGSGRLYAGLALCSPVLAAYVLHLVSNSYAKQQLFSCFFKGMKYERFCRLGEEFARRVDEIARPETVEALRRHVAEGDRTYVVSASIEEWVRPWCTSAGVEPDRVLATRVEVVDGHLTGRFSSKNCHGAEKVRRLLECEPNRADYVLYAYGDSRGDREMLQLSDFPKWVK